MIVSQVIRTMMDIKQSRDANGNLLQCHLINWHYCNSSAALPFNYYALIGMFFISLGMGSIYIYIRPMPRRRGN